MKHLLRALVAVFLCAIPVVAGAWWQSVQQISVGGGGGGSLTFTATDAATAWTLGGNSVYNISSNIGTAASDRVVVVAVYIDASASNATAVAINAVSLTSVVSYSLSNGMSQAIYASAPGAISGSGAQTVDVTTVNAFPGAIEIMVGTITGSASATVANTNSVAAAASTDPHSITATVPSNGVAVIAAEVDRTVTPSWTGATGDGNVHSAGANGYAALLAHGTSNTVSFTGANNFQVGMLMATWQP